MIDIQNGIEVIVLKLMSFGRSAYMPLFDKNVKWLSCHWLRKTDPRIRDKFCALIEPESFPTQPVEDPAGEQGLFPIFFVFTTW